jgi:hypothetical protein
MRLTKAIAIFAVTAIGLLILEELLAQGPTQPPPWYAFLFLYGEVWGIAYVLHTFIHLLSSSVLGALAELAAILITAFVVARAALKED